MNSKLSKICLRYSLVLALLLALTATAYAKPVKVLEGTVPPLFDGVSFEGKTFNIADVLNKKPIVINFLSLRCVSCLTVVKTLEKFRTENSADDHIAFVYVSLDDWKKAAHIPPVWQTVFQKDRLLLNDGHRVISKLYEVDTLPATILINKEGKIFYRRDDFNKFFEKEIKEELGKFIKK